MNSDPLICFTTVESKSEAQSLAKKLVESRLVACVNVLPGIESVYRWQENIEFANEVLLICKTTSGNKEELQKKIEELHSYDVPELVFLRIEDGLPAYLNWLQEQAK